MTTHQKNRIPTGLSHANEQALSNKIAGFVRAGASNLHLVFDFDRTLTVHKPDTNEDITTWHILGKQLPDEGKREHAALFAKYRPIELAEGLTEALAAEWWAESFNLLVRYKVNMLDVEREFVQMASIRPGTIELFGLCKNHDIPVVILSAGVRDVIDVWGRAYAVEPSLVLSTALKVDKSGVVVGWDQDSVIHVLNKHEAAHHELTRIRANRPKAIIIGDSMSDADMAMGDDDILRIRVFDPRDDEVADITQVRARTFERFDAIIESGDFGALRQLVQLVTDDTL